LFGHPTSTGAFKGVCAVVIPSAAAAAAAAAALAAAAAAALAAVASASATTNFTIIFSSGLVLILKEFIRRKVTCDV
jgi:outer membrane lipoprotein-sorting protein